MKNKALLILVTLSFIGYSQKKTKEKVSIFNANFYYTKIDYTHCGMTHVFLYVLSDNEESDKIEKKVESYLKTKERLYHTCYFFLRLPSNIKTIRQKEIALLEFIKLIDPPSFNFFLMLQEDISKKYLKEINYDENLVKPYRLVFDLKKGNAKKYSDISIKEITILRKRYKDSRKQ